MIKTARQNFKNAFEKAKSETAEIKDDLRPQRLREKIRPAAMDAYKRFDELRADLKRRAGNLAAIRSRALEIKQPESETAKLIELLKAQEIRRGFESLPHEKQFELALQRAEAGDRTFYDALLSGPFEIVPEHLRAAMQQKFIEHAAAKDETGNLRLALDGMPELQREAEVLDFEIRQAEKEIRELLAAEQIGTLNEPVKMSESEKTAYIGAHGVESFRAMFDSGIR